MILRLYEAAIQELSSRYISIGYKTAPPHATRGGCVTPTEQQEAMCRFVLLAFFFQLPLYLLVPLVLSPVFREAASQTTHVDGAQRSPEMSINPACPSWRLAMLWHLMSGCNCVAVTQLSVGRAAKRIDGRRRLRHKACRWRAA